MVVMSASLGAPELAALREISAKACKTLNLSVGTTGVHCSGLGVEREGLLCQGQDRQADQGWFDHLRLTAGL